MIRPESLKPNDTIAIVATARKVTSEELTAAINIFKTWGLKVVLGKNLFATSAQFAGNDADRLEDIQDMINNPDIKAIVCARGGYGTTRIIDNIDFSPLQNHPKWIVGFSDITALLYHLYNQGIESIHGIMAGLFHKEEVEDSIESLRKILFGEPLMIKASGSNLNRPGEATGIIVGGNLSIINNLIGTRSDIDMTDKILFIEDLDEYLYHIDRMMVHLKRAGKIQPLKGLIVDSMSDMNDNAVPFGKSAYEIIREHIEAYNFPVSFGFPVGHEAKNLAIPVGREASVTVSFKETNLSFII